MDEREQLLEELRPQAFAIAYRMLGSVSEAEDVVQEGLLRLHQALEAGRGDRVAPGLPGDRRHPARHRRAALGAVAPGDLRRRLAARAAADHGRRRPAGARRDGRLAVDGLPGGAGEPHARAARGLPVARGLRLPLRAGRRDRRHAARRTRESSPHAGGAACPRVAGGSTHPASRARSWRPSSSPRSRRATSRASRRCWPRTWSCKATAAARRRPWRGPFTAPAAWRGRSAPGCAVARRAGISWERVDVNGQPGAVARDPEDRVLSVLSLDVADGRIQGIASVVNPDKLRHIGEPADLGKLLAALRDPAAQPPPR